MAFTLRPLLFKLHLYIAVAVAAYVVIMGVTGAIMAFETEISRLGHSDMRYVTPAPPQMGLDDLVAAVEKSYPGQPVTGYVRDEAPDGASLIGIGEGTNQTLLSVNPYTGQVLGKLGDDRMQNFLRTVTSIHQRLTPPSGFKRRAQVFMSWVTVAALFLTVSGIYLWFPRMRFRIAGRGRLFWYDLHATLGIAAALFIILLTGSAIIMSFRPMIYALTGSEPPAQPKSPPPPADGAQAISIGRALAIGTEALNGAAPLQIVARPGLYAVVGRKPGETLVSLAFVDKYSGTVLATQRAEDAPVAARVLAVNRRIHGADIFGMPSKVILALASLLLAVQVVSGAVMWLKRASLRETLSVLAVAAAVTGIAIYTVVAPAG